jgi:hypothetical protein
MSTVPQNIKKLTLKQKKNVLSFHAENAPPSVYSSYFGFHRLDIAWIKENHEVFAKSIQILEEEREERTRIARKQAHLENEAARLHGTLKGVEKVMIKKGKKKKK